MTPDQIPDVGSELGFKLATLLAGFIGGVASLHFVKDLKPKIVFMTIFCGAFCAAYFTPVLAGRLPLKNVHEEYAIAFAIGLLGMNLVGGFYKLSSHFREDPIAAVKSVKSLKDGGDDAG